MSIDEFMLARKASTDADVAFRFVNILAEDASVVAAWMVPRMRGVRGSGKYFK